MDFNLERFLTAQKHSYQKALSEIRAGKKQSHWMWYIFPQIEGLGQSETAKYYAIKDMAEAILFLHHPVLGKRLVEISKSLLDLETNDANGIFGSPDDLKLRSSMTLFGIVEGADPIFQLVIDKFFNGMPDVKTISLLH